MCVSMYHLAVCCRCRMDGNHAARVRPLDARHGQAFSRSLTARPIQLPLSGGYLARPRRMQRVGMCSVESIHGRECPIIPCFPHSTEYTVANMLMLTNGVSKGTYRTF